MQNFSCERNSTYLLYHDIPFDISKEIFLKCEKLSVVVL